MRVLKVPMASGSHLSERATLELTSRICSTEEANRMGALLAVYLYTEFQGEFADAVSRYYGMLSSGSSTADEVIVLAGISDLM